MPTAEQYRKALERLADSTEMAGAGDESQWTGAAAAELWHRIRFAKQVLTDEFHRPPKVDRRERWELEADTAAEHEAMWG